MIEMLDEPIRVFMDCNGAKVRPVAFLMRGKKYIVRSVNLVFEQGTGPTRRILFSVSDAANAFTLMYNPFNISWKLTELHTEA